MPTSFLKRYRFEDFIDRLDAFMKINLDSYIDQMNTDRTDLVLAKPSRTAQVDTITPTPVDGATYTVTVNGVAYAFVAGVATTATLIVTGLKALINADANANVVATGTATLILTSSIGGYPFTATVGSGLARAATTANVSAYYFQALTDSEVPFNPFIFYGETGTESQTVGPDEVNKFTIQIAIIMANSSELQGIVGKRLLRYRDCFKAMFNDGWNVLAKRLKVEVTSLSPFPFSVVNQEVTHVGIGVTLEIEIA